jgi:hypothetical protein
MQPVRAGLVPAQNGHPRGVPLRMATPQTAEHRLDSSGRLVYNDTCFRWLRQCTGVAASAIPRQQKRRPNPWA